MKKCIKLAVLVALYLTFSSLIVNYSVTADEPDSVDNNILMVPDGGKVTEYFGPVRFTIDATTMGKDNHVKFLVILEEDFFAEIKIQIQVVQGEVFEVEGGYFGVHSFPDSRDTPLYTFYNTYSVNAEIVGLDIAFRSKEVVYGEFNMLFQSFYPSKDGDSINEVLYQGTEFGLCRGPDCPSGAPFQWSYGLIAILGLVTIYVIQKRRK